MVNTLSSLVKAAISKVEDPEVPVPLNELGVIRSVQVDEFEVRVVMAPTRVGCPGRDEMARRIVEAVASVDPNLQTQIEWHLGEWQNSMATSEARVALRSSGWVLTDSPIECPYCGSGSVSTAGDHGGSVCAQPFTCRECGTPFDAMRGTPTVVADQ